MHQECIYAFENMKLPTVQNSLLNIKDSKIMKTGREHLNSFPVITCCP